MRALIRRIFGDRRGRSAPLLLLLLLVPLLLLLVPVPSLPLLLPLLLAYWYCAGIVLPCQPRGISAQSFCRYRVV